MRITDKMIHNRLFKSYQKAAERLANSQERIATQKNIKQPSDDPVGFMKIVSYNKDLQRVKQTIKNAESAHSTLSQMESILQEASDLIIEARTRANAASSDTYDADARMAVAGEIDLVIEDMVMKANTNLGGKYIFAGQKILTEPYQVAGNQIDYMGDQGEIRQRVELNGSIVVNTPGENIFGTSDSGLFSILQELKAALEDDDAERIRATLPMLDDEIDNIADVRGEIGMKIRRTEVGISELNTMELNLTSELSKVKDADLVQEAGQYMANQQAYQAALEVTASILRLPNLLDYLK
ncbi:flagellar hook-associated protein 3 [Candidatus Poribacteria bacterium]|nr:flagellar hook-associated protein 3 [Candidatus Poribacteria bacterium]